MKKIAFSVAAAALFLATSAVAAELPTYEANGFPASPVQVRLLGAAHVQEQSAAPATAVSAHQLAVLTPRHKLNTATAVTTGTGR